MIEPNICIGMILFSSSYCIIYVELALIAELQYRFKDLMPLDKASQIRQRVNVNGRSWHVFFYIVFVFMSS